MKAVRAKANQARWYLGGLSNALSGLFCLDILIASTGPLFAQRELMSPLNTGIRLFERGKYSDAVSAFRSVLEQPIDAPTRGKATFNLGLSLQKLGRYDEAIQSYLSLLTQPVDDKEPGAHLMETYRNYRPRAQWEIGSCLFAKKDYTGAMQAYRTVKEKYPFRSWCGNELAEHEYRYEFHVGLCLDHLGKPAEALRHYYRAAFLGRLGYGEPEVHFRILDIYQEAGQSAALSRLLEGIDAELLDRARKEAEASNVKLDEQLLSKVRPTQFIRRILELRSFAEDGRRSELIKLLKIRSSVTGPPDDLGNWEAVEAARLLALDPNKSVPELLAVADQTQPPDDRWVAYALGRCGNAQALEWLKQRASKEENYWAVRSFVYAISLAGNQGRVVLESLLLNAGGNLRVALVQQLEGRDAQTEKHILPKVPPQTRLPQSASELR